MWKVLEIFEGCLDLGIKICCVRRMNAGVSVELNCIQRRSCGRGCLTGANGRNCVYDCGLSGLAVQSIHSVLKEGGDRM